MAEPEGPPGRRSRRPPDKRGRSGKAAAAAGRRGGDRQPRRLTERRLAATAVGALVVVSAVALAFADPILAWIVVATAIIVAVVLLTHRSRARATARLERELRRRARAHEMRSRRREQSRLRRSRKAARIRDRTLFAQLEALGWLMHLLPLTHPLKPTRGMAASPDLLLTLVRLIDEQRPASVVEMGSGASTVVMAARLKSIGTGRLVALEHDADFGDLTRRDLALNGLDDIASVVQAPLTDVDLDDATARWYDIDPGTLPAAIDMLFVDGPPMWSGRHARYPALPLLAARLSPGAVVILDDTSRPDEEEIARRWHAETPGSTLTFLPVESGAAVLRLPRAPRGP